MLRIGMDEDLAQDCRCFSLAEVGRRGRHTTLVCVGPKGALHIHNMHLDHATARGRSEDVRCLSRWFGQYPAVHHVWGGDMNFFTEAADRVAPAQPQAGNDPSGPDALAFQSLFGQWVELFQPQMTHKARTEGTWCVSTGFTLPCPWATGPTMPRCAPLGSRPRPR